MEFLAVCGVIAVVIWAAIELVKHMMPSWYDKESLLFQSNIRQRLKALEEKLGIKPDEKV